MRRRCESSILHERRRRDVVSRGSSLKAGSPDFAELRRPGWCAALLCLAAAACGPVAMAERSAASSAAASSMTGGPGGASSATDSTTGEGVANTGTAGSGGVGGVVDCSAPTNQRPCPEARMGHLDRPPVGAPGAGPEVGAIIGQILGGVGFVLWTGATFVTNSPVPIEDVVPSLRADRPVGSTVHPFNGVSRGIHPELFDVPSDLQAARYGDAAAAARIE